MRLLLAAIFQPQGKSKTIKEEQIQNPDSIERLNQTYLVLPTSEKSKPLWFMPPLVENSVSFSQEHCYDYTLL